MKTPTSVLIAIGILLITFNAYSQDRTLNGFTANTMFASDSGFIENRFGFRQVIMTQAPIIHGMKAFAMGEQVSMDIKLHDYVGVSGKFAGTFQIGESSVTDDYQFATGYNVRADGNLDLKILRLEEIGSQWIFHLKTTYQRSNGLFADTSNLSSDFDKTRYLFLEYQDRIDIDELTKYLDEDIRALAKSNAEKLTFSTKYVFVGGGGSFSLMQVISPNIAILASVGAIIGDNTIKSHGVELLPSRIVQTNLGIAGCVSLHPITPITLRAELEHESSADTNNNLVLGSVVYSKENTPASVTISAGEYFIKNNSTPIGSVTVDLYF